MTNSSTLNRATASCEICEIAFSSYKLTVAVEKTSFWLTSSQEIKQSMTL